MKKLTFLYIVLAMVVLLCSLSYLQNRMNGIRTDYNLTDAAPLENAPPIVAFSSVALGGFRGLLADYLWLRSSKMQDEGKYFEMVQLADWIVTLQPRYTMSHAHLAWNMAYNVSVTFTDFSDRWRWVKRGIELIRDKALDLNPGDPELYRQLGWIYQHKLGKDLDDANRYYKTEMAKEMIRLFGDYYGQWELLEKAPLNETKLRAVLGDNVKEYERILASHGMKFEDLEMRFRSLAVIPQDLAEEFDKAGITETIELCLRHRWIFYKYKLDPKRIMKLNEEFGPLDWRLPQAHAIYWAKMGMEQYDKMTDNGAFKRLQVRRMIFQSLKDAFETGKLMYLRENYDVLEMTPNLALAESAYEAYKIAIEENENVSIKGALGNFIVQQVCDLYKFGRKKEAMFYFQKGREVNPGRFVGSLEEFVAKEIEEQMTSMNSNEAMGTIQGCLYQAYYTLAFAPDENSEEFDQSKSLIDNAKLVWTTYQKLITTESKRKGLPPFEQITQSILTLILNQMEYGNTAEGMALSKNLQRFAKRPQGKQILEAGEIKESEIQ